MAIYCEAQSVRASRPMSDEYDGILGPAGRFLLGNLTGTWLLFGGAGGAESEVEVRSLDAWGDCMSS